MELRQKELELENIRLRKTNEDLRKNELMLQRFQRIGNLGYFYLDYQTGAAKSSTSFNKIIGLEAPFELELENLKQIIHPAFQHAAHKRYHEALQQHKRFSGEYKIIRPVDGSERWVNTWARIEFNADQTPALLTCIIQDITEQKQTLQSLDQSLKLNHNQNERLLNFSYIVSHNLRSHSSNFTQLLEFFEKTQIEEERRDIFKHLKTVAWRFDDTLRNLNDVVSIQKSRTTIIKPLQLKSQVDIAVQSLGYLIAEKNAIVINNVPETTIVDYNPAFMENILHCFLSNALKYSHPERQPLIRIDYFYEEDKAILQFQDNGLGIDLKKHREKLFGMYKTFHRNADARGIGLFLSKGQVEAMGGRIEVESEVNIGSTFKIQLK
jgi:PAS domain S-box-containing protein